MANHRGLTTRINHFIHTDIWRIDRAAYGRPKAILIKTLQVVLLAIKGYIRDNCALRASALTYYTLLAVVPVVAMAFGMAKGFGLDQRLEVLLYQRFAGQEAVLEKIIGFARTLLENTQSGLIAGIGVALLFWSAIKVLNHIEGTLNTIWKVKSRSFIRQFTDYLTIMVISPLLVVISSSVNVYIRTQVTTITGRVAFLELVGPLIFLMLKLIPYGLTWLLFILIFLVMPNTRVRISSAIIAGLIGGTIFQLSQGVYIHAQVLLSKYNAVYGSFAALPFFLIWLQLSWMIVLVGAQIAYAHQHVGQHAMSIDYQATSALTRKKYAIYILHQIVIAFEKGMDPPTLEELADRLTLPHELVAQIVDHLVTCRLVSPVGYEEALEATYQPARDINTFTIADVLAEWDKAGNDNRTEIQDETFATVNRLLEKLDETIRRAPANQLIKDL